MISRKTNKGWKNQKSETRESNLIVIAFEASSSKKSREYKYFDMLEKEIRNSSIKIKTLFNEQNRSAINHVLNRAKKYEKEEKLDLKRTKKNKDIALDQMWLVTDVDHQKEQLLERLDEIRSSNYNLALSNPCFEIWLYLHKGKISLEHNNVIFSHYRDGKEILEEDSLEFLPNPNADAPSKRVKTIFGSMISGKNCFRELFLGGINDAISKSEEANQTIQNYEDLLNQGKGRTNLHKLVKEIIKHHS
ncbi:MAG: RloB family protein [Proteobacteria bacterium]|nr:RloB family protein [Pseudomonadota bacterium]